MPARAHRTRHSAPLAASAPPAAHAHHAMVVAANPLAAQAGLDVLRAGGSAADAAVAVQAVLGLVEPQSSGLGGGAFITYYDARSGQVIAYNGRETAPAGATADMFLGERRQAAAVCDRGAQRPLDRRARRDRGAGALLQHEHGKLAWRKLFGEAERLATDGFVVSPRLAGMIASRAPQASAPDAVRYFSKPDGTRLRGRRRAEESRLRRHTAAPGERRPARAATRPDRAGHRQSRASGRAARHAVARGPGAYQPIESRGAVPPLADCIGSARRRRPVRRHWRCCRACCCWRIPISRSRGSDDPIAWVELGEAERLMYADRDRYVGDPAFVNVPVHGLLDAAYSARPRRTDRRSHRRLAAARPAHRRARTRFGPDHTVEPGGTTHLVIVDADGNVLSMTTTVESIFGSGRMVDGFFLNNQLTDFSFSPLDADGQPGRQCGRARQASALGDVADHRARSRTATSSPPPARPAAPRSSPTSSRR